MRLLPPDPLTRSINPTPKLLARDYWLIALLTSAGLALRLVGLNEGLWYDEIVTLVHFVRLPLQEIMLAYGSKNNHVLYSMFAHLSSSWLGESAWSIRIPAVLLGSATIPAAFYLGLQLAARREAFLATALLTASYHHVWYSQSARGYTGSLLCAVLLSILIIRLLHTPHPRWSLVWMYALIAALGTWLHLTAALVVVAHSVLWLIVSGRSWQAGTKQINWRAASAIVASGILYLSLNVTVLVNIFMTYFGPAAARISGAVPASPASSRIDWLFNSLAEGLQYAFPGGAYNIPALLFVTAIGVWSYLRQGLLSWGVLMLPFIVIFAILVGLGELIFPRFLLPFTVFLFLVGVRGGYVLAHLFIPTLTMKQIAAIGLAAVLASALMVPRAWQPKQEVLAAYRFIQESLEPGDGLACIGTTTLLLQDYLGLECPKVDKLEDLLTIEAAHRRTWFVYTLPLFYISRHQDVWNRIHSQYTVEKTTGSTVHGGEIVILLKSGGVSDL